MWGFLSGSSTSYNKYMGDTVLCLFSTMLFLLGVGQKHKRPKA